MARWARRRGKRWRGRTLNEALPGSKLVAGSIGEQVQAAANVPRCQPGHQNLGVTGAEFAQARYARMRRRRRHLPGGRGHGGGGGGDLALGAGAAGGGAAAGRPGGHACHRRGGVRTGRFPLTAGITGSAWRRVLTRTAAAVGHSALIRAASRRGNAARARRRWKWWRCKLPDSAKRTTVTGLREPKADAQTIRPDAELVVCHRRGLDEEAGGRADACAGGGEADSRFSETSRASLGSSKSLVDLGGEGQAVLPFLSHLNQIGQTGATPRHAKGLSTCCHGEEPHTVGWRFIGERRAISLDPNCGWARGKADVLYVADAFAVIGEGERTAGVTFTRIRQME